MKVVNKITIEPKTEQIAGTLDIMNSCCNQFLDKRTCAKISVAIEEAISNVILYSETSKIEISCIENIPEFIIEIKDYGKPFDITLFNRESKEVTIGGYGIMLMKKIMDRIEYCRECAETEKVNVLKLTKIIKSNII